MEGSPVARVAGGMCPWRVSAFWPQKLEMATLRVHLIQDLVSDWGCKWGTNKRGKMQSKRVGYFQVLLILQGPPELEEMNLFLMTPVFVGFLLFFSCEILPSTCIICQSHILWQSHSLTPGCIWTTKPLSLCLLSACHKLVLFNAPTPATPFLMLGEITNNCFLPKPRILYNQIVFPFVCLFSSWGAGCSLLVLKQLAISLSSVLAQNRQQDPSSSPWGSEVLHGSSRISWPRQNQGTSQVPPLGFSSVSQKPW